MNIRYFPPQDLKVALRRAVQSIGWGDTKGRPDVITFQPKGFRDLFWCPSLNEPAILEWEGDEPRCPHCGVGFEAETHEFICHVGKP